MKQLFKRFKQITILLLAITFIGCEDDDVILPEVVAGFTYTLNIDTGTVTFINISENAHKYEWDLGDGNNSSLNNPINTYTSGEYTVTLKAINIAGASDTFTDIIVISDVGAPVITLLGDTTINLMVGDTYTDPGATATDDVDGDLTANIIVVGVDAVDVNTAGTYTITYNVSDSAGNAATERTRTVIVTAGDSCEAETEQSLAGADFNLTFMTDPTSSIIEDGGDFEWVDNPDFDNDVNKSCKVGQITKLGNNPWDNNQIDLDAKLDFNANEGLKIKVWSPIANTEVRIKLEEIGNAGNNVEQFLTTSVTSGWEELTFPFSSADSDKFNKIVIFFDLNANNTDAYYFDDLKLYGSGSSGACVAETSESYSAADLNMTLLTDPSAFIISDGAGFEWIDNPDFDNAVNTSCKVGEITKAGNNPWDNNQFDLDAKLDFNANEGLKIKVWSALANTEVRIKLEEIGNPGNNVEQFLTTSVTSAWEELTFPFSSADSDKFNKIVIFFDLNANNTDTYYFDDLELYGSGGGGGGDCPAPPAGELLSNGDFEAGESCWQLFDGTSISTTVSNGGSNSGQLQGTAGVAVGLKQERFAAGTVQPNTSYTVTFDIISSGEFGTGGVFKVFTFSEGADGGSVAATQHILADGIASLPTTWTSQSYTFTTPSGADQVEGGLSFYMEIVNSTSSATLNVDNVVVKETP